MEWVNSEGYNCAGQRCSTVTDGARCDGYAYTPSGSCASCALPCEDCGQRWPNCECGLDYEEVRSLLADIIEVREGTGDTIALTAIEDDGEGSGDATLAEIRAALGSAYTAEWTGDSDTDEDGVTTSDVRIERVAS